MKNTRIYNWSIAQAWLMIISVLVVVGAGVYKLYALNWWGVVISLLLSAGVLYVVQRYSVIEIPNFRFSVDKNWTEVIFVAIWCLTIGLLWQARTGEAIISPWEKTSPFFFWSFGLLTISLFYLSTKASKLWAPAVTLYLICCYFVVVVVYQIGYGFDPFIHQATVKFIDDFGSITPKPLYYSGQYALEIIIHKLTGISLVWLDKLLLPVLASLFLPVLLWEKFKDVFKKQLAVRVVIIILTTLMTSLFFLTTPQGLSYFFLVALVVSGMSKTAVAGSYGVLKQNWPLNYCLAVAALVTQPVAGIPALLAVGGLHLYQSRIAYRKIFVGASLFLLTVLLPLSFFLIDKGFNPASHLSLNRFDSSWLIPSLPNYGQLWLNFTYAWQSFLPIVLIFFVVAGYFLNRRLRAHHDNHYQIYWWQGLAMIGAYLLTKTISFSFLIDYERDNYADRMLVCAMIFWLPLMAISLYEFIILILKTKVRQRVAWAVVGAGLLTATVYLAYPRYDEFVNSHGYATSRYDLEAVTWIDNNAQSQDYVVLANQQTSAAALQKYGFAKYYKETIFYYPVPTGGELYQYYLALVREPTLAPIQSAGQLAGVKNVYVVIDDYWWQAKRINAELRLIADETKVIRNDKVNVFKFRLSE